MRLWYNKNLKETYWKQQSILLKKLKKRNLPYSFEVFIWLSVILLYLRLVEINTLNSHNLWVC